ncbi:uncharacterized protein LOC122547296, partial [Chiloscyllium plagiosum]|uniref:uncharacterized protein LOC122547296 n=1 Tax=Chiloscyllium plagiosum TaxID=36176 RepID=UPI001CB88619
FGSLWGRGRGLLLLLSLFFLLQLFCFCALGAPPVRACAVPCTVPGTRTASAVGSSSWKRPGRQATPPTDSSSGTHCGNLKKKSPTERATATNGSRLPTASIWNVVPEVPPSSSHCPSRCRMRYFDWTRRTPVSVCECGIERRRHVIRGGAGEVVSACAWFVVPVQSGSWSIAVCLPFTFPTHNGRDYDDVISVSAVSHFKLGVFSLTHLTHFCLK